jgi:hypothetical protein
MGSGERTILRIRCSREISRQFKKIAVDYGTYENALEALIQLHEKCNKLYPELLVLKRGKLGKYAVYEAP